MNQEIKTPQPHGKKLFEWDSGKKQLSIIKRKQKYLYELGEDNLFTCINENKRLNNKTK